MSVRRAWVGRECRRDKRCKKQVYGGGNESREQSIWGEGMRRKKKEFGGRE